MKRYGNLWGKITALENIAAAHKSARKGKTFYTEVKMVDADPERFFAEIQRCLVEGTFTTSPYEVDDRFDGRKLRTIHKLPYYPDRIVQHALLNIVGPILTRTLIRDTFQSITGRGTSDAAARVKKLVRSEQCPRYALKVDIAKYYPNVDNTALKNMLRRKIKCPQTLRLLEDIVDSTAGLPIGNFTSQILGNLNLNGIDWWMKQTVKPAGYFRYCDDLLVFSDHTAELVRIKSLLDVRLAELGLSLKPSWGISDVHKDGVDFVGYRFRPESTRLRSSISSNFKRCCNTLALVAPTPSALSSLMAYKGWVKRASAKQLWRGHTHKLRRVFPQQLRTAV